MNKTIIVRSSLLVAPLWVLLAACTTPSSMPMRSVDNAMLPEAVRVPTGHKVKLETVGMGELTYECREKKDMAGQYEWGVVGPQANLTTRSGTQIGKYYAGPTWEANDGSKVTASQVATAASITPASIPLQLLKANPATGMGAMSGVSYIQRLDTRGGVAPTSLCDANNKGLRKAVTYQADYIFYSTTM